MKAGDLIRTRRTADAEWFYGVITRLDESGLIHLLDAKGRRRELTSVDAKWMRQNGNLESKPPKTERS